MITICNIVMKIDTFEFVLSLLIKSAVFDYDTLSISFYQSAKYRENLIKLISILNDWNLTTDKLVVCDVVDMHMNKVYVKVCDLSIICVLVGILKDHKHKLRSDSLAKFEKFVSILDKKI